MIRNQIKESIFALCRDLVEGGKPQFLLYYKFGNKKYKMTLSAVTSVVLLLEAMGKEREI